MGFLSRFVLFLYSLCVAFLSLGVILLMCQLVPERYVWNEYQYLVSDWRTGAGALLFFLLSVHLLFCSFSGKENDVTHDREIVIVGGDNGNVQVTLEAVKGMVHRLAVSVNGVREAKVACVVRHTKETGNSLEMDVKLTVGQERSVGSISDDIRHRVSQHMENIVGVKDYQLAISVQNIVGGVAVKKRRVQ